GGNAGGAVGGAGGGAGTVGGFVGMLQQLQQIRNSQENLDAQQRTLGLFEANLQAGLIDGTQVDLVRQNIETERATLLAAQVNLANTLETYKFSLLGVPPDLPMQLEDGMIEQFRLVDARTTATYHQVEDFIALLGELPKNPVMADVVKALEVFQELRAKVE